MIKKISKEHRIASNKLVLQGDSYMAFNEVGMAQKCYSYAVILNNQSIRAQTKLAKFQLKQGNYDAAMAEFASLCQLATLKKSAPLYFATVQFGYAMVLKARGEYEQAANFCRDAIVTLNGKRGTKKYTDELAKISALKNAKTPLPAHEFTAAEREANIKAQTIEYQRQQYFARQAAEDGYNASIELLEERFKRNRVAAQLCRESQY